MDFLNGVGRYLGVACGCLLVGFIAGAQYVDLSYERQIAEYRRTAAEQQAALQEQLITQERQQNELVRQVEQRGLDEKARIDALYRDAVNELERLRADRARDEVHLPDNSATASRAQSACKCRPLRENEKVVGTLGIARDCDLLAVRYNQLLQIYNSLK